MRHPLATAVFLLLGLAHLHLVATVLLGFGSEPPSLFVGHVVCLGTAIAAALACARGLSWAWRAVATYGGVAAVLMLTVGPALDLPVEERTGLWLAAATVLILTGAGARRLQQSPWA